ncbi:helix-turn-helix domain-containing protein [Microbacterium sp. 2C]|nr:helix-turn-helix domain-containing protein [Microbacterium paulum]MBG0717674.1 helix-turn-helix domain-containing protein [Microbacterium paulum]
MFGSRLLDTSPSSRRAFSSLLELSGRYAVTPAHLAELAAELKVSVQTIYDLRSKGRGPHGFRVGTQLRFRKSEIDAWVERMEQADEQRHAGGAA